MHSFLWIFGTATFVRHQRASSSFYITNDRLVFMITFVSTDKQTHTEIRTHVTGNAVSYIMSSRWLRSCRQCRWCIYINNFYLLQTNIQNVFLDWLLKTEEDKISYDELKMLAQDRSRWCQWIWKPAIWAEYYTATTNKQSYSPSLKTTDDQLWCIFVLELWDVVSE